MNKHTFQSFLLPFKLIHQYWVILTLLLLVVISILSLMPLPKLPSVPGSDKTHHFIAYAALMFPTALRKPRYWLWIALFFIVYSGMIELIQPYANRYGEWLDLAANTAGILIGILIAQIVRHYILHHK